MISLTTKALLRTTALQLPNKETAHQTTCITKG